MPQGLPTPEPIIASAQQLLEPVHGTVATAPAGLGQPFTVVVPELDTQLAYEVRYWTARGLTVPAVGDLVLLVFDERREPWAVAWWPATGDVALGREHPFDYGVVTALPTKSPTPVAGDRCTFKVATGHYWDLAYTAEATYPWAKIGGLPLQAQQSAEIQRTTTSYESTGCPSLTAPLAMEFRGAVEDTYAKLTNAPVGAEGTLRAIYVNAVQKVVWQVNIGEPLFGGGQSVQRSGALTVAKGQTINTAYASALGNKLGYVNMSLLVDPLRVG